ncbi:hypothetical protein ADUPG1_012313 [Aduncisulcus paluster]|uniref:Transposase n=1 Tax=Aduncisulcus paluster TaxID=2918883 RepID=A0ABQ5JZ17_9EUKA|nr:hypothetical protein ADUPG1_012313 [Aduncisulcus paluster]
MEKRPSVELCLSTCYDLAHSLSQKALFQERKKTLVGHYSIIMDKTTSRGKSILTILAFNGFETRAVGYIDVGAMKDAIWSRTFVDEVFKSYWSEMMYKHAPGIRKELQKTNPKDIKKAIQEITHILACLPPKIREVMPKGTNILCTAIKNAFQEIGIKKRYISSIVTDREPLMVAVVSKQLEEEGYGYAWIPCTAHLLSTVIQHYFTYFFEQIETFLEDLNVVLSTGSQENRALCSLLAIHAPRYTKVRWTSLLEEYSKVCSSWDEIIACLKFKGQTEPVKACQTFLENESYRKFTDVLTKQFIPCALDAIRAAQYAKPNLAAFRSIYRFAKRLETEWSGFPVIF